MIAAFATSLCVHRSSRVYTILIIFTDVTVGKKRWAICTSLSPPPPFGQRLNQLLIAKKQFKHFSALAPAHLDCPTMVPVLQTSWTLNSITRKYAYQMSF